MESRNGGASSKGFLIPVSDSSDVFQNDILAPLQSAYLYEESKQFFRYKSAALVKNPDLEDKYEAFRTRKRNAGYSEDDLKETYGFLLFDDSSKANSLGETGVISGNGTCTTLGDPAKGVYISMYSDCLDLNRWYHGKSGYIAIIRLTKGKVKKVAENYTQNFTEPTVGYDCHVSEHLPSVSAKTSSFLAFERTQFYIYELLHDGSSETSLSPSAACPFAIVSFSYMDTKASAVQQDRSVVKKQVHHYFPWRGRLQIEGQFYHVDLRAPSVALIPVQLPSVIKVNQAIHLSVLRSRLPRAVFETNYTEEAFLDGLYYHLCEFVSSEADEASSFALLLSELKEKDLAFCIPLNDGGFLILMHSSHFLRYDDAEPALAEVMQGLFVFPNSRVVRRDTKFREKNSALSYEILHVLPVLSYAEGEAEKTSMQPNDELSEVLTRHIQSYAALLSPGFSSSPSRPSRELSMFPDQYDMAEAYKHLYSSPEWNTRTWETLSSYFSKPGSFQLPVAKVSEILASGEEERREELDDDVYICLSSPEEAPTSPVCMEAVDQLSDEQTHGDIEKSLKIGFPNAESQKAAIPVCQRIITGNSESESVAKGATECPELPEQPTKTDDPGTQDPLTPPTSEDLPAELIVSITSAEQNFPDEVSTTKHTNFPFSGLSTMAKLQTAELKSALSDSSMKKKCLDFPKVTKCQTSTKRKKRRRIYSQVKKKTSKTSVKTHSLKTVVSSAEVQHLNGKTQEHSENLNLSQLINSLKPKWKKLYGQKHRFGKLSSTTKKLGSAAVDSVITEKKKTDVGLTSLESPVFLGFEALPLRKKMERWDLKPVISECGRMLLPFGSVDFADQVRSMHGRKKDECLEKVSYVVPVKLPDKDGMEKQVGKTSDTTFAEATSTTSVNDENHEVDPGEVISPLIDDLCRVPLTPSFCSASPKKDDANCFSSKTSETEKLKSCSQVKLSPNGDLLLSKLKSVLSKRKRTFDVTIKQQNTENVEQESESCLKKSKVDSDTETPMDNIATPQNLHVSKMISVDPLFAYCLGLTPKDNLENVQDTKELNTLQRKDSTEKEEHSSFEKPSQIIQRPLSIFPRRCRIKTLRRHQGVTAENVKKKWWLHFQSPACITSEKKYNDCTSDNTVRKTFKEKVKSTCTSTDALNLLADLALSNDKVPPQPNQAPERTPKESAKKCDLSKSLSSADQESVLHALLRNPAARHLQPPESPSKCSLVAKNNLVSLISEDHAYSLPPSSLLLDLSGTTFQVPPLSGSTRLLNHHQRMYGDGTKTLHHSDSIGDMSEHSKTSEYLHKNRRKLKLFRTFIMKETSIQVTRKWEENYNFDLDSKFTSDPKDKVIIRALHGPWDSSMQDTAEEVRLIFHMWIGLFYSRSTSRFFQVDPSLIQPCSEENGSLEMASGMLSGRTRPEVESCSAVALSSKTESPDLVVSKLLDLSKKESTVSVPEPGILDLSVKNIDAKPVSSEQQFYKKVLPVSIEPLKAMSALKPAPDLREKETFQFQKQMVDYKDISSNITDDKSIKPKTADTEQKLLCFGHNEAPSSKSDRIICQSKEMTNIPLEPETDGAKFGDEPVLRGCNEDDRFKKVDIENRKSTVKSLPQEEALCPPTSVMGKEVHNIEESILVHTSVLDDVELNAKESCQMGNNPYQEDNKSPSLDTMNRNGEPVSKESDIVCNVNVNEKLLSKERESSLEKTDNREGNTDCCTKRTAKEFKNENVCVQKDGDESETCIDRDLTNRSLTKLCNGLVQQGYSAESCQTEEKLPMSDSTQDALCVNPIVAKEKGPTFETCNTPSDISTIFKDTVQQENLDMNKTDCQKVELPIPNECRNSFNDSPTFPCSLQEKDCVQIPNRKEASDQCFYKCSDHSSPESNSAYQEENPDQLLLEPQDSPTKRELTNACEVDEQFAEKSDPETDETRCRLSIGFDLILNPCVEKDVSPKDEVEKVGKEQEPIPFISEGTESVVALSDQKCCTTKISTKKREISPCKISFLDETFIHEVFRKEFDSRPPTPTIDENPHDFNLCPSSSSRTDVPCDGEDCQNLTPNSIPSRDVLLLKEKLQTSSGNTDPTPPYGLVSDVKIRTLRVLHSLNKFLEIPNKQETSVDPQFQSSIPFIPGDVLHENQKASVPNLSIEFRRNSQSPVMAEKLSKSKDDKAHWPSKGIYPKTTSHCEQARDHLVKPLSPSSKSLNETKQLNKNSDGINSNYSVFEPSSKTDWLASTAYSESNAKKHKPVRLNPPLNKRRTMLKLNQIPSSVQCSKSEESYPELWEEHQKFIKCTVNWTAKDLAKHFNQRGRSNKSNCDKDDTSREDGHIADSQSSLKCTIFNTDQKTPYSFLDQISQRCLQNDLTRASMEQECLIFAEQMKNLLKKSKGEPLYQPDTSESTLSCTSPLIISFSNLEEQEDSMEFLDTPLVRQKILVDMSNSKDLDGFTEEGKVFHSLSQENSNPLEHAGISALSAECARLYSARMHDICSAKKVLPRSKIKKVHQKDLKTDTRNHFDFCDQMKKELDRTFQSNLNAVVKKSCKTKYRFYILATSDEVFFKETKAQFKAEGHTAVEPSEFFLNEESSSTLFIILRNEDIAEHICKIPYLLKLKMTPGVLFAGIDEPDDVINLTHQELFTRAGFVMLDRAVLETISICDMKRMSKVLQELSRIGKWKWMLHYRDSRRLKEDARLGEEANQKKLFMYWCQDAGILEVLPYHECDQLTKDGPDYLACLLRLQVQHISSRFPVFIADAKTDSAFERNGILTMTLNTFLTKSTTEIFRA